MINSALDIFESKVRIGHSDELEVERVMKTGESGVGNHVFIRGTETVAIVKG